ncbi:MAG: hypothetical protein ACYS0E_13865, partial [Planctomycetota bacterium]
GHAYDQIGIAVGLVYVGTIFGSSIGTLTVTFVHRPARRPVPILFNLSPVLFAILFAVALSLI